MKNFRTRGDIERDLADVWRDEDLAHEMARLPDHQLRGAEILREARKSVERLRAELAQAKK